MNKQKYSEYLLSSQWKTIRNRRIKIDGFKCQKCGTENSLQVHHLTYERVGNEWMQDLKTLCAWCHEQVHKIDTLKYHCCSHPTVLPDIQPVSEGGFRYVAIAVCPICDLEISEMSQDNLNELEDFILENESNYTKFSINNLKCQIDNCREVEEFEIDDLHNPMYFEPADDWEGVDYHNT